MGLTAYIKPHYPDRALSAPSRDVTTHAESEPPTAQRDQHADAARHVIASQTDFDIFNPPCKRFDGLINYSERVYYHKGTPGYSSKGLKVCILNQVLFVVS